MKYHLKMFVNFVLAGLKRYAMHKDLHIGQTSDEEVRQMVGYSPQLAYIT